MDWVPEQKNDLFLKGQSKRIWAELYKVLDCSDVVLHVIDARDVPGTKCDAISKHIQVKKGYLYIYIKLNHFPVSCALVASLFARPTSRPGLMLTLVASLVALPRIDRPAQHKAKHKHLVYILNKIDMVPTWVAKRWVGELSKERPTIAFHASITHAFGKGALISLLRQFSKLMSDKKQISVGVVGYPNSGKSSVINTLIGKKSCKVAPVPGETKIWQYITLMKRIYLIDCPGVVVDRSDDSDVNSVLRGVVRAERLPAPEDFVPAVLERVKRPYVAACFGIPEKGEGTWSSPEDLLDMICKKTGRLRKGGEPDRFMAAVSVINAYQRGKLPHFVAPPELKDGEEASKVCL